jgi:hypothetical protein
MTQGSRKVQQRRPRNQPGTLAASSRLTLTLSALSLVIACASAAFTGLQWREAHNASILQSTPHVVLDTQTDPASPLVGVKITNAGPGLAVVKAITFYVDHKTFQHAGEAMDYVSLKSSRFHWMDMGQDDVLAINETDWLIQYTTPVSDENGLADFLNNRLAVGVRYCSAMREDMCWYQCSKAEDRCKSDPPSR